MADAVQKVKDSGFETYTETARLLVHDSDQDLVVANLAIDTTPMLDITVQEVTWLSLAVAEQKVLPCRNLLTITGTNNDTFSSIIKLFG